MPLNKVNADSIADGTVVASDIADGTITLAKLQSGLLPTATANSAAAYANAAFATANTGTASGSYANSAFAAANSATATDATQNTNITAASSYANAAFATANTGTASGSYANSAFSTANTASTNATNAGGYANSAFAKANTAGTGTVTSVATGNGLTGGTITSSGTISLDYYTGSTAQNTSYPIGSYLLGEMGGGVPFNVNASATVYTPSNVDLTRLTVNGSSGTGSVAISGTWRSRGVGASTTTSAFMMQRTA